MIQSYGQIWFADLGFDLWGLYTMDHASTVKLADASKSLDSFAETCSEVLLPVEGALSYV